MGYSNAVAERERDRDREEAMRMLAGSFGGPVGVKINTKDFSGEFYVRDSGLRY